MSTTCNDCQDNMLDQLRNDLANYFDHLENYSVTQLRQNHYDTDKKIEDLSKQIVDDLIHEIRVYKDAESISEKASKQKVSDQQISIKNHLNKTKTLKKNISKLESDLRYDNLKDQADLLSLPIYYMDRVEKGLSAKIRRKIKVDTYRKSLREDLAIRLFAVFSKYDVEVSSTIYDEKESFSIFILSEIFYALFDGRYSEPSSIKNMIMKLKKERLEEVITAINGITSSMIVTGDLDESDADSFKEHLRKKLKKNPF